MRQLLLEEVRRTVKTAFPEVEDEVIERMSLDPPRDPDHGDFATNAAFLLKDVLRDNPRRIAEALVQGLSGDESITDAEVAGPGFINFRVRPRGIHAFLQRLADPTARAALTQAPELAASIGRIQIEFVSANPTGPMNVVSARAAAFGDACIRLLRACGVDARSEFYVNDAGNQAEIFGRTIRTRFLQAAGRTEELAEDAYQGEYVTELAAELYRAVQEGLAAGSAPADIIQVMTERSRTGASIEDVRKLLSATPPGQEAGTPPDLDKTEVPADLVHSLAAGVDFSRLGIASMVEKARASLSRFGVEFDRWFRESALHTADADGHVRLEDAERLLEERGHIVERDGARWFTSTEFGDDKDRVIRRSDGRSTYLLADVAYHLDKARRGFDRVVDVWGPDHHGYIKRLHSATVALGLDEKWLEVLLVQQVNLMRAGEPVKMSKREGEFVTLDELMDEVGKDVSRFFFLMRRPSSHVDFDLELAKQQTLENPVFYVQYAHARTRSIFRQPMAREILSDGVPADPSLLVGVEEVSMMRTLLQYPEVVKDAARALEPHRLVAYLREVAGAYHRFYTRGKQDAKSRVLVEDQDLSRARLFLVGVLADVLKDGLGLLGIEAVEEM